MTFISWHGFWPNNPEKEKAPPIRSPSDISIVIPVRDNQAGVDHFIEKISEHTLEQDFPREIIVVDNNSNPPINLQNIETGCSVKLFRCKKPGPSSARNIGLKNAQGSWVLFTDSDCTPTETLISGYIDASNGSVGYAGNVLPVLQDPISKYYESQGTLIPSRHINDGVEHPDYLVTANCLIWKDALRRIEGFNESISFAAGEDIDIGFRLREIGNLSFAWGSLVYHDFNDGLFGFMRRFWRYGKGNGILSKIHSLDMRPRGIRSEKPSMINTVLSKIQHYCLLGGYYSHSFCIRLNLVSMA